MEPDEERVVRDALSLARELSVLLRGRGPDVQGACLAELVSLWLVGHQEEVRRAVFEPWLELVWELVAFNHPQREAAILRVPPLKAPPPPPS